MNFFASFSRKLGQKSQRRKRKFSCQKSAYVKIQQHPAEKQKKSRNPHQEAICPFTGGPSILMLSKGHIRKDIGQLC